jgi:dTDP-glucose 4,6-dehydratase
MKLLVTGGAGFIGSNFISYILSIYPTYSIINLDKLTYAGDSSSLAAWSNDTRYQFVQGDICDKSLVDSLVKECDAIVHFAAESHVDRSIHDASAFIQTNIIGTFTLLESARAHGNKRFHHISTDEVFGQLLDTDAPFNETTPYDPRSPYSASKASSDHLVMAYFHTYGLPVTISNCSNNYGPFQFPEKLIPLAITNLLEGKQVPVYGDGKQVRDWLYVEDHCNAIDVILHKGKVGEVYCVGGNSEKKNIDVVSSILSLMERDKSSITYVTDRAGHDRRYAISFRKLEEELGWKPSVTFEDGLKKTVAWYTENKNWWESKKHK